MFHPFQRVIDSGILPGAVCAGILLLTGCTPAARSPDAIRQDSAAATAAVVRDTKAAAQGVFAGLRAKGPMNINKASESELETLPGIDAAAARRIIAGRPYETSMELMRQHVISRAEYGKIANKVVAR
jgi:DNA uptake protein ComE-like DNA-binding protein